MATRLVILSSLSWCCLTNSTRYNPTWQPKADTIRQSKLNHCNNPSGDLVLLCWHKRNSHILVRTVFFSLSYAEALLQETLFNLWRPDNDEANNKNKTLHAKTRCSDLSLKTQFHSSWPIKYQTE